jgi:putative ABC transport system permease protein
MDMAGGGYGDFPAANAMFLRFSASGIATGWLLGAAVSSAFTLLPSLKSAFVEPVEALRQ